MKWIGLGSFAMLAGCQTAHPAPANRPLMEPSLAAKLCTNPDAVSVFGADCVMRDQSPPPPTRLPPPGFPK
jgi:hypothetical protein